MNRWLLLDGVCPQVIRMLGHRLKGLARTRFTGSFWFFGELVVDLESHKFLIGSGLMTRLATVLGRKWEIGIFEQLIHGDDELPHDGSQGEFRGFASGDQREELEFGGRSWAKPWPWLPSHSC